MAMFSSVTLKSELIPEPPPELLIRNTGALLGLEPGTTLMSAPSGGFAPWLVVAREPLEKMCSPAHAVKTGAVVEVPVCVCRTEYFPGARNTLGRPLGTE